MTTLKQKLDEIRALYLSPTIKKEIIQKTEEWLQQKQQNARCRILNDYLRDLLVMEYSELLGELEQ